MVESDYRANTRDRLRRAERTIRRLRLYLLALVVLVLGMCVYVWTTGQLGARGSFETVAARSFKLVDRAGNLRGGLGTSPEKGSFLTLTDTRQNPRIRLGVPSAKAPGEGTSLVLSGDRGAPRAVLRMVPEKGPRWTLMDPEGNPRFLVDLGEGTPSLLLLDREKTVAWRAP